MRAARTRVPKCRTLANPVQSAVPRNNSRKLGTWRELWGVAMSKGAGSSKAVAVLAALAMLLGGTKANAALISFDVAFSVGGFVSNGGGAVPVDPVIGSLTVIFDPTVTQNQTTTGITLNSVNLFLGGFNGGLPPRFNYNSASDTFAFFAGLISSGTNGMLLTLNNFTGLSPSVASLIYSQAAVDPPSSFSSTTGTVSVTASNAVPLPAALPLFATGLGALGLFGWRRKQRHVTRLH